VIEQLLAPTRVLRDYLSNSMVWDDFLARGGFVEGDIVVADPFKAGTTWTQRIVQQILQNGKEKEGVSRTPRLGSIPAGVTMPGCSRF
jgi:aryl sulfotransferase